jgi:hypothetical protein
VTNTGTAAKPSVSLAALPGDDSPAAPVIYIENNAAPGCNSASAATRCTRPVRTICAAHDTSAGSTWCRIFGAAAAAIARWHCALLRTRSQPERH